MKNIIVCLSIIVLTFNSFSQNNDEVLDCMSAIAVCGNTMHFSTSVFSSQIECEANLSPIYYKFYRTHNSSDHAVSFNVDSIQGSYTLYGPFRGAYTDFCEEIALGQTDQVSGSIATNPAFFLDEGWYVLKINPTNCTYRNGWRMTIQFGGKYLSCESPISKDCEDCISSFSPTAGQYQLSAWVKGKHENRNTTYTNPSIKVSFDGASDTYTFNPSGSIIDGWQQMNGQLTVPATATAIKVGLNCADGMCYFDDIRFLPMDGSMVSYVYDPVSLKLVAQLDERNYATFYEYDEEGKLIRVKKETERGIMTIQENRDNSYKR